MKNKKAVKCYTINIPVKTFWLVFLPLCLFLGAVGALAGFFVVDLHVMPKIVGVQRDLVDVPDVHGLSFEDAREKLFRTGLLTENRGREFNEEIAEGAVLSQFPDPGEQVKKGRRVSVTISRGAETGTIPSVRGMKEHQARNELRRAGFSAGNVRRVFHGGIPLDGVVETSPPEGTTTSRALDVEIMVSRGPRPTHADVPNVIGESLAAARKKIEDANLKVGRVSTQSSSTLSPGVVMSQSAAPGSKISFESSIDIVVSTTR